MDYPDLDEVGRRAKRYWTGDGVPDLVMGCIWMLWGGAFLVQDLLPRGSRSSGIYSMILPVGLIVSALAAERVIRLLKSKYTFPRGGYVQFREPTQLHRFLSTALGGLAAAALVVMIAFSVRQRALADLAAPAIGALMAAGFLSVSRRHGARHYIWYALMSAALGGALFPLKLEWMALPWYFLLMGIPFAIMGACRLRSFVRSVPVAGGYEP